MNEPTRQDRRRLAILQILADAGGPLGGADIRRRLEWVGEDLSERAIRVYLAETDRRGLTQGLPRRGRLITPRGRLELRSARTFERVGFLSARIDRMSYAMTFDVHARTGSVLVNTTLVDPERLRANLPDIQEVFRQGYAMGTLAGLLSPGQRLGELTVPPGLVGFCTVCSITLNGVLLKHGIPTASRFGGLLELDRGKPVRFAEIILYEGTSIDPLEIFIRSGMTDYLGAIRNGTGRIGASFREVPEDSLDRVRELGRAMVRAGLGNLMRLSGGGASLLGIPVMPGRAGAIVIGGLNPVAILEERGFRAPSRALAGLMEYDRLFPYTDLPARLADMACGGERGTR